MSCDISIGRALKCHDIVGGINNIYFVPYGTMGTVTLDSYNRITSVSNQPNAYQFEVTRDCDLTQAVTSNVLNGSTYVEQTLRATLKQLDYITDDVIMKLAYSKPHIIIEDMNGNLYMLGYENGNDMTTTNVVTGRAMGDLAGYQMTFVSNEKRLANYINGTLASVGFIVIEPEDTALTWDLDEVWQTVDVNWEANYRQDL